MTVIKDEWSGLFAALETKVNAAGRTRLLDVMISDVYEVTYANFGETGIARPAPWADLKIQYAIDYHDGDTTPTLVLSGALRDGFVKEVSDTAAVLFNTVEYADKQQFGKGMLPARPYYPVDEDGENFTPFMEYRLQGIVENHFGV